MRARLSHYFVAAADSGLPPVCVGEIRRIRSRPLDGRLEGMWHGIPLRLLIRLSSQAAYRLSKSRALSLRLASLGSCDYLRRLPGKELRFYAMIDVEGKGQIL